MKGEIFALVKKEFEIKRLKALAEAENRLENVRREVEGFSSLEKEIGNLSLAALKEVLKRPDEAEKINSALEVAVAEKGLKKLEMLASAGYSEEYLNAEFQCSKCEDTGVASGQVVCSCFRQKMIEMMFMESGLVWGKTARFEMFDANIFSNKNDVEKYLIKDSPRNQIGKIRVRCEKYVADDFMVLGGKGLLFFGNTGTGKTFMAQCIANDILLKGFSVAYVTAPMMFDKLNEARMNYGEVEHEDYFATLKEAELLVIDDLGTETSTDAKASNLLQLLNARDALDLISPRKTIISTNLNLTGIREKYDERIYSRIVGKFITCQFGGEDLRIVLK
ncbi:MAG: ATP-binding protein [Bacillota bacterium]